MVSTFWIMPIVLLSRANGLLGKDGYIFLYCRSADTNGPESQKHSLFFEVHFRDLSSSDNLVCTVPFGSVLGYNVNAPCIAKYKWVTA